MAYPLLSDMVIVWGSWFDERTRQGETLPVTFTPLVSPASSETPLLTVAAENAWIKTREWKVTPDPATGFFAVPLTPNNDPDVTAFSGYRITPGGETPRTAEVPADADTMTVTAQLRDYLQKLSPPISVTVGDTVKAKKVTELALIDPAPVPPESFFDSTQTTAAIASGILAHDTDPEAHQDIRDLIGSGGGGTPSGPAGGVLSGTYPNPGFAQAMATQDELDAVAAAKADTAYVDTLDTLRGLAVANASVPAGLRAHAAFDTYLTDTTTRTFRVFVPLTDSKITTVLPKFPYWLYPASFAKDGDMDPGQPMTIAAAVEMSDGTVVPFTFNGAHTFTFPGGVGAARYAIPDEPLAIGDQIVTTTYRGESVSGFWMRVYVSVAAPRTDTVGITAGSATVTDPNITSGDRGKMVVGTGVPVGSYVGTVTANTSFLLSSAPTAQANVNATATNASLSATLAAPVPLNLGQLVLGDGLTTVTGADLTLPGSGTVSGGSGIFMYGPAVVLARTSSPKPIVALVSDSILDGYSEDFNSPYWGPVARVCTALNLPLVKLAKAGSTSLDVGNVGNARNRVALLDGCTHAIVSVGTNDQILTSASNVTTMQNRLLAIGNLLANRGIKTWLCTIPPRASSTDGFATTANQTPTFGSQSTYLASLNSWAREVPAPFVGCFDLAFYCESSISPDSGLWKPNATVDGVHPSPALMVGDITDGFSSLISEWTV